jgi:hypothetical protein
MKKTVSFMIMIIAMMVFTSSCKKVELAFTWAKLEGTGTYSSADDTSTIKVEGWLRIEQSNISRTAIVANAVDWQFQVMEGQRIILQLNKDGYHQVLGDVFINTSDLELEFLWVYIETTTPKAGDIFNGANPDTMELAMLVQDDTGNIYEEVARGPFTITRD